MKLVVLGGTPSFFGALGVAAGLEAAFGLCLGCKLFELGMRAGVVPESVCEECRDIWNRREASVA